MGDYKFVMGVGTIILVIAYMIGPMGAASTLVPGQDVGPGGEDFDTDRLQFQMDADIVDRQDSVLTWTGIDSTEGSYGFVRYDVTDRSDIVHVPFDDGAWFSTNIGFFVTDSNEAEEELTGGSPRQIDLSGSNHGLENIEEVEIRVGSTDAWVYPDDAFSEEEVIESEELSRISYEPDEGFFTMAASLISTAFNVIVQFPGVLLAWIAFATILPGGIGYIALGFITLLALYLLLRDGIPG